MLGVFLSGLAVGVALLALLGWKWRVKMSVTAPAGVILGALAGAFAGLIRSVAPGPSMAALVPIEVAIVLLLTLLAIGLRFYRDPERFPVETRDVILAPADGRVIYVNKVEKGSSLVSTKRGDRFRLDEIAATNLVNGAAYLVGIEMNVLNVHVNRSPVKGTVVFQRLTKGKFMSLRRPESEAKNERVTTVILGASVTVVVIQIASRLVRRIVRYVKEADDVEIGQRIGAIVFGSQVDVIIPAVDKLKVEVKPGDETKAGVSVIARY